MSTTTIVCQQGQGGAKIAFFLHLDRCRGIAWDILFVGFDWLDWPGWTCFVWMDEIANANEDAWCTRLLYSMTAEMEIVDAEE